MGQDSWQTLYPHYQHVQKEKLRLTQAELSRVTTVPMRGGGRLDPGCVRRRGEDIGAPAGSAHVCRLFYSLSSQNFLIAFTISKMTVYMFKNIFKRMQNQRSACSDAHRRLMTGHCLSATVSNCPLTTDWVYLKTAFSVAGCVRLLTKIRAASVSK